MMPVRQQKIVREFLAQKGITETIPTDHVHRIRHVAGIHFPRYIGRGEQERTQILQEALEDEIREMIKIKGISMIFIDGHNPCGGCMNLGIGDEEQKILLRTFGQHIYTLFGLPTVVIFEDHSCDHHDSDAIAEFGLCEEATNAAA